MELLGNNYLPGDQRLIEQIMRELKSQGIFDQFRKECISDVDTKPAYQNLRQRVEGSVSGFLTQQTWRPEMNKNQVREMLRKNIFESGFLETGVERIVDQVVNPKITTVFLPKVEDVVYKFLGIEKPIRTEENFSTPLKINTFHDLLPKDLEAISPELPDEKDFHVKSEDDCVKMEEDESPSFEFLTEKNEKIVQEENSVDSQSSVLSVIVNHDSNQSQKQDSLMSLNSSESRMSLNTSENTPKLESDDVFISQKSSDSNSKSGLQIDEKTDVDLEIKNVKNESDEASIPSEETAGSSAIKSEKNNVDVSSKSSSSSTRKRDRTHSSSDRSKSRSNKDKDRSRSDKRKKDEKESSKEEKTEKEKYRIPKLSDKNKNEKDMKSREKDSKSRDKQDKNVKIEKDKNYDKNKKSSKHSSERDRSKSESRSKKESKSDKKEKDDKRDSKKDSSRSDKSKDDRRSSSSKKRDSSSKDSSSKKLNEEKSERNKNGHSSSSSKKDSSKHKKDEDRSKSSHKKDEKNDKDDKKKKRSSKEDYCSSADKKNGRRSSDRDSDGPSNSKKTPSTPQKNTGKSSSQKSKQESYSNLESSCTGDSGNSDKIEEGNGESTGCLGAQIKLPKFASNLQEAMKIMKIRKQLKKLENMKKLNLDNSDVKKLLSDIAELSKDGKKEKREENIVANEESLDRKDTEENQENKCSKAVSLDITDFISSSNISMAKWNALEAKFMEELGGVNYDSYESPYIDDEESDLMDRGYTYKKMEKVEATAEKGTQEVVTENGKGRNEIRKIEVEKNQEDIVLESCEETVEEISIAKDYVITIDEEQQQEIIIEETVENMEETIEIIDETTENIQETTENTEETSENNEEISENNEETTENIQETTEDSQETIENIQETTENIQETTENIQEITEDIQEITDDIQEITEDIQEITKDIQEITEDIQEITEDIQETAETIEETAKDIPEITEDIQEIAETIEEITEDILETTEDIQETAENMDETTVDIEETYIDEVTEHIDEATANVEEIAANIEQITANIEKTNENIEKTNENIEEDNNIAEVILKNEKQFETENTQMEIGSEETIVENTVPKEREFSLEPLKSSDVEKISINRESVCLDENSSKSSQNESVQDTLDSSKLLTAEDFKRKAIILLHKHPLAEEMIKKRKNGEHSIEDVKVMADKSIKVLDTQNIEINEIVSVDKKDSETHLENGSKCVINTEKNRVNNHNHLNSKKRVTETELGITSSSSDQKLTKNNKKNSHKIGEKLEADSRKNNSNISELESDVHIDESAKEEDLCLGLEQPENERILSILKSLIKALEDNVRQSVIKKPARKSVSFVDEKSSAPQTRKRKLQRQNCDISNNNLEDSASKRLRIKNSQISVVQKKTVVTSKKRKTEESTDITTENKFILPLSPAESEPSNEKKREAQISETPSRRQSALRSSNPKGNDEVSPTIKKSNSVVKGTNERKNTNNQRYSSEDLYKPRMFLRRSGKGSKNS